MAHFVGEHPDLGLEVGARLLGAHEVEAGVVDHGAAGAVPAVVQPASDLEQPGPEAVVVAHHRLQHVGRLAEAAAAEGGVGHRAHQGVDAAGAAQVQGLQRVEAVLVSLSVSRLVSGAGQCYSVVVSGEGSRGARSAGSVIGSEQLVPRQT